MTRNGLRALVVLCFITTVTTSAEFPSIPYPWINENEIKYNLKHTIRERIQPPKGFIRTAVTPNSYAHWLRNLPLKKAGTLINLYNGKPWIDQSGHHAVVDIDTGNRDLQQCADAIMRLRAEYLFSLGKFDAIHFHFANGDRIDFKKWRQGFTVRVKGNKSAWIPSEQCDSSYRSFRNYMSMIFAYAGTMSMNKDTIRINDIEQMQIGDIFINHCHAIVVADMAENPETGKKVFLIAQGMMPAMDVHIVKNEINPAISPWFELDFGDTFTIHYGFVFEKDNLYRYP